MPTPDAPPTGPGGLPIWYGMDLGMWLRLLALRPPMHWSRAGHVAGITAASCLNSVLNGIESAVFGRRVARTAIDPRPLFLLGHWRSGTTLLHNLLSLDPRFAAPTAYQVQFPGHFLLTQRLMTRLTAPLMPSRRPSDERAFGWDLPEEDEFALLVSTLLSPYLRYAFPDESPRLDRLDDLRRNLSPKELARWKSALSTFLKKVTYRTPDTLLLKSPTHTGRIPLLVEMFPEARFVYIVRNPYDVFSSSRHAQRATLDANGLGRGEPSNLDERILTTYMRLYEAYHLHRALVRPERRCEIRFEDLEADPIGTLEGVYRQLQLDGFDALQTRIDAELSAIRSHRKNRYRLDDAMKQLIYERWRPAFKRYGYPS